MKGAQFRRPSAWWLGATTVGFLLAVIAVLAAVLVQREATRPIGEGDLFLSDVSTAAALVDAENPDVSVREVRNQLGIEGVSLVDRDGTVFASTSENQRGSTLSNDLLSNSVVGARFAAVALAIEEPLILDGVEEWTRGDVLYQVTAPIAESQVSMLLYYDVAELLGRRTQPGALQTTTLQLAGIAVVLSVISLVVLYGRGRAARKFESMEIESNLLRSHSVELEAANRELEKARKKAEDALSLAEEKIRIRSEFVLMINHELRTPLTAVVTGAEILRSNNLDESERDGVLGSMVDDGARLVEIIDQILAVARIENRGLAHEISQVALSDLEARLNSRFDPSPVEISGAQTDLTALALVVASLGDNARTHGASDVRVRLSPNSTVDADIQVGTAPSHAVYVTVADDGPGIDRDFLPRIFEKFEKSSFSSGTGLGLYMTRMIVEALGGSLSVETSVGGTTFEIAIPAIVDQHAGKVAV